MLKECPTCQGKGYIVKRTKDYDQTNKRWITVKCDSCLGKGFINK